MKWDDIPKELRERIIRQDPTHFSASGIVVGLPRPKLQPDQVQALDESQPARKKRCNRLSIVVTIVSFRHRLLDDDNLPSAFKGVRDSIAKAIGLDDGDKRFKWEYRQVETIGTKGTLVTIEVIG